MKKALKIFLVITVIYIFSVSPVMTNLSYRTYNVAYAHSGRTDSSGGHKDNKNKSGLGSYHYHCGGHPAHLHENGVCPYDSNSSSSKTSSNKSGNSSSKSKKSSVSKETIYAVQEALNDLDYDCGEPDGVCGKKTKAAIKEFQKDNDLTVNGKINKQVKKALGIEAD